MQVSWIDADQISALAEGLRPSPKVTPPAAPEPEHDIMSEAAASFGFAPTLVSEEQVDLPPFTLAAAAQAVAEALPAMTDFRTKLQAIRDRAIHAGLMPRQLPPPIIAEAVLPELPAFSPLTGSIADRIAGYAHWAGAALPGVEIYIVGDHSELLWGQIEKSGLILSAIMASGAATRMSALSACENSAPLRQTFDMDLHLTVIPCSTRLGTMHVAMTSPSPLPDSYLSMLSQALIAAIAAQD